MYIIPYLLHVYIKYESTTLRHMHTHNNNNNINEYMHVRVYIETRFRCATNIRICDINNTAHMCIRENVCVYYLCEYAHGMAEKHGELNDTTNKHRIIAVSVC